MHSMGNNSKKENRNVVMILNNSTWRTVKIKTAFTMKQTDD